MANILHLDMLADATIFVEYRSIDQTTATNSDWHAIALTIGLDILRGSK